MRMIERLKDQNTRAFADDKAIAFGIKRAAGTGGLLVARGKRFHGRESTDTHWRDRRFRTAADHYFGIPSLKDTKRIAHRVGGGRTCRRSRRIRSPSAVTNRKHARSEINDGSGNEKW